MIVNPTLSFFAPRKVRPISFTFASELVVHPKVGGVRHDEWTAFLFQPAHPRESAELQLLGGADDTGGSAFEMPMAFMGDSPRAFLVLYCAFVDGIDRGINLPLLYTLKTDFNLSQLAATAAIGISLSPWLAKPLLGLITDTIPIFGYRRKPYIFTAAGLNAISLVLIAWASVHHFGGFLFPMALMTLRTFGRALIDAAAQGLLLEDCREGMSEESNESQAKTSVLVSRYQAAHRLGQFINVCASGYIMATSSITTIYITMAAVHVGTMVLAWSSDEAQVDSSSSSAQGTLDHISDKFDELKLAVSGNPAFTNVLEYAFLAVVVPSYEAPMAYYLLDARKFSIWSISLVNIIQTSGSLIAPVVYSQLFQKSKYSSLMTGLTVASIPASLMPLLITTGLSASLGWDEVAVASVSAFVLTLVNDLQMMPAHVLVAQLARRGLEGSCFSILTVVEGAGRVISMATSAGLPYLVGAVAPRYSGMTLYIVICTMFNVGPFSAIEGFDDIRTDDEAYHNAPTDESLVYGDHTLAGVMRELRDKDDSSVLSSESDQSPVAQISLSQDLPIKN